MNENKSSVGAFIGRNALLLCYALFALFPLLWMLILSFKPDSEMFGSPFVFHPTLDNFRAVLGQSDFLGALVHNSSSVCWR